MAKDPIIGLSNAPTNKAYQDNLSAKVKKYLGKNDSRAVEDLKKTPIFDKIYKSLSEEGQKRFDAIMNLDGDAKNVSEKELRTLLTILDADLQIVDGREKFVMDGEDSLGKSGAIYEATDDEIKRVYNDIKTKADIEAEEVKKLKEASENKQMQQKSREILSEAGFGETINLDSYKDIKLPADANLLLPHLGNLRSITGVLEKGGIEYEETEAGIKYTIADKTYVLYEGKEEHGDECAMTDVFDSNGKKLQTFYYDSWRTNGNGDHVLTYDDKGKVVSNAKYFRNGERVLNNVTEYKYDENGQLKQTIYKNVKQSGCFQSEHYISYDANGKQVEYYLLMDGILSIKRDGADKVTHCYDKGELLQ